MAKKSSIAQARWDKENVERFYLKLHRKNDADIIGAIDPKNKQGSIKDLIRKAIKKDGE